MATSKFQVGQVVELKSGGPDMTIEKFKADDGKYFCAWIDSSGKPQGNTYFPEMLQAVDSNPESNTLERG